MGYKMLVSIILMIDGTQIMIGSTMIISNNSIVSNNSSFCNMCQKMVPLSNGNFND